MNKSDFIKLIDNGLSIRNIANELNVSISTIRYWLNFYNLKTINLKYNKKESIAYKICPVCKNNKAIDEFYFRDKNKTKRDSYCKVCRSDYDKDRFIVLKIKAILYKGGKCIECNKSLGEISYGSFHFHHVEKKDIDISKLKYNSWAKTKNELDKCILLCANCHGDEHVKYKKTEYEFLLNKYKICLDGVMVKHLSPTN